MSTTAHPTLLLEHELFTREARRNDGRLDELLADDFIEIGASGRRFRKPDIIAALANEEDDGGITYSMQDVVLQQLAPGLVLLMYRLTVAKDGQILRVSERSSLWRKEEPEWRIIFHQGTRSSN